MRRLLPALLAVLLTGLVAPPAGAGTATDVTGFASATNGIAVAADGNIWVAEDTADSVVRVSPTGQVIGPRIALGGSPEDVAAGPGGTVWVSVPNQAKLVRISSSFAATDVAVAGCATQAVTDGGNGRMYVSCPNDDRIASVDAATGVPGLGVTGVGEVYDLTVASGKLFAPDANGAAVRRISLAAVPVVEATYPSPPAEQPNGITALDGDIWITYLDGPLGKVAVAAPSGTAVTTVDTSTPLLAPAGITASSYGTLYVASTDGAVRLAEVTPAGVVTPLAVPTGAQPFQVARTDTGAIISDVARTAVIRLVDRDPVLGTPSVSVTSPTTATVTLPVDSRGNATTWRVGTATGTVPASAGGPTTITASLTGLTPGVQNRLALQAENSRGSVVLAGFSITTPAAAARVTYKAEVGATGTRLKKLSVRDLAGGETVTVTCKGRGCPAKKKTYADVAAGTLKIGLLKKAVLRPGAKVKVAVSSGLKVTLKVRAGKKPKES